MRYSFFDQLAAIRANPGHVLPADINAPVFAFLAKIGCAAGADSLKRLQNHVAYGTIELVSDDQPGATLTIQVDSGMAEGWKIAESTKQGKWAVLVYKTIKNSNLDKSKPKKGATK
jgi:hypothetical protein